MEFRRGGHRGERRRRALIDEPDRPAAASTGSSAKSTGATVTATEPARRYTDAALAPRQRRVIDLIPTRRWTNLVLAALILSCAAGVEALYGYLALGHTAFDVRQFPAINLAERGSVATWFSSALLATCAVFGLLVYQIRRYRVDDYRGRYRMWCWVVPVFLLASIDQVAGLQESVRTALLYASGIPGYGDAMLVWVSSVALLAGALGVRLIIEMRASRLASLMILTAVTCFGAVGAAHVGWMLTEASVFRTMALSGLTMGAHIALLLAMFLYARHVHRDACGQLRAPRERRQKVQKVRKRRTRRPEAEQVEASGEVEAPAQDGTNAPRRSKVRRQGGKVLRTDPPHTPSSKKEGGNKTRSEAKTRSEGGQSGSTAGSSSSAQPARKEKRRVTADASTTSGKSAASMCEPDDEQVEEDGKLSKAERKRQRKQRRRERQS